MSSPQAINQKKIILSTTEVSKLLISKGRRKINESFLSHNPKTNNNIDITELTSQINIKMSKENETGIGVADQSMFRGVLEKSVLFKSNKVLDKSGFINNFDKFNQKDNLNLFSKLEKSQIEKAQEGVDLFQEIKPRKKNILRIDTRDTLSDKNQMKISYIIKNYFPYENDINNANGYIDNANKLKNYLVIFYFKIEKNTFLLIKKFDKKLVPVYFWNREEDAKKFGIKYSQITTPGLYFKTYENFLNAFKEKMSEREEILRLRNIIKENNITNQQNIEIIKNKCEEEINNIKDKYEKDINNIKNKCEGDINNIKKEYDITIKEINNSNDKLKKIINELEKAIKLKDDKINELTTKNNELKDEINIIRLVNEKMKRENLNKKISPKDSKRDSNKSNNNFNSLIIINNKNNENEKESDNSLKLNKFKSNSNIRYFKKSKTKALCSFNQQVINFSDKQNINVKKKGGQSNYKKKALNKIYSIEKIIQIEFISNEISMPKLEEYFIENEEEDEINKIKNINKIKTYGDKKSLDNSSDTYNNNFLIYINENSNKINENNNKDENKIKNIYEKKYEDEIKAKNQEIMILKNKIENLNLEIQNKAQIIDELKYLIESKSNKDSNFFDSVKDDSSSLAQKENNSNE